MVGSQRSNEEPLKGGDFCLKFSDSLHAPFITLLALLSEPKQVLKLCLRLAH
jgi:hypothetical protein